jgi:dTDP-4-amino-4,6-dideoxygalactose transaminase
MTRKPLTVTQPDLPPLEEFIPYLEKIWESKWLTNNGPFHGQLEQALCEYFGVEHLALFTNGTVALITALQTMRITGEVITTPYSFVATSHALLWNDIQPVFVDIDPVRMTLDPAKIEAAITPRTTAIMPVHCYGYPCDVEAIQRIADTYGLKLIYDAAHAFGVRYKGQSLLTHGDLSVLSFHATKVFNTFEGGAIICPDAKTKQRIDYLKNFGFADEVTVMAPGINGKMNEFQAALGMLQLTRVDAAIAKRKALDRIYRDGLANVRGITLLRPPSETEHNSAYFPILVEADYPISRDELYARLRQAEILARRYFYPLISDMPMYRGLPSASAVNLPNARSVSQRILCLPIYPDLAQEDLERVVDIIARSDR